MALQRAGNPNRVAVVATRNLQKLILLLLSTLVMISCADALPGTQSVLPKSRLRLYNIQSSTTKTLSTQVNLPPGMVNNPYSGSIVASGGVAPYS